MILRFIQEENMIDQSRLLDFRFSNNILRTHKMVKAIRNPNLNGISIKILKCYLND